MHRSGTYTKRRQDSQICGHYSCYLAVSLNSQIFMYSLPCSILISWSIVCLVSELFRCSSDPSRLRRVPQFVSNHFLRSAMTTTKGALENSAVLPRERRILSLYTAAYCAALIVNRSCRVLYLFPRYACS